MDEVLFISYYFPPIGGAGVQRSLKFCRYLPEEQVQPVVIAGPERGAGRWEPQDLSLANELAKDIAVYRPEGTFPEFRGNRLGTYFGRPPARYRRWQKGLFDAGMKAVKRHRPRAIYVTLSPFEGLEPAIALAESAGLPIVADLRDPWALDEMRIYPTRMHRHLALVRMARLLARCQRVLWNTPEALCVAKRILPQLGAKFYCLSNGFDSSDFEGLEPRLPDGRFRIVHAGYLHSALAGLSVARCLGGQVWPIDVLGRSHWYLLRALERIQLHAPSVFHRIEVVLVGSLSQVDKAMVQRSTVADGVRMVGYLRHALSVSSLVEADLLFLPMHGLPRGCRARMVPAKAYEYLASGRPILAAVPDGDARDLLLSVNTCVVWPSDVDGMTRAILEHAGKPSAPARGIHPSLLRFERRELARELANHLRQLY